MNAGDCDSNKRLATSRVYSVTGPAWVVSIVSGILGPAKVLQVLIVQNHVEVVVSNDLPKIGASAISGGIST